MVNRALLIDYIPMDRVQALAANTGLPHRTHGSALFADISGFTKLTETLARTLGARRGAEELTGQLNLVYDALVTEVHRYGGSVIGFGGDAITCWFDEAQVNAPFRAVGAALAMQHAMQAFSAVPMPDGSTVSLAMKVAIASGPARRFLIGDPNIQFMDALAGHTVARMAEGEHHAEKGEVLVDENTARAVGSPITILEWREDESTNERFGVIGTLHTPAPTAPWPEYTGEEIAESRLKPWLLPTVYERVRQGLGEFVTELRSAVAIFLRFDGIYWDEDEEAGQKLDAFIQRVQQIIDKYGGSLLQIAIGDKGSYLYATFGTPIAHEDDEHRATAASLELSKIPTEYPFINPLQIGISRGNMRAGAYGAQARRTYGVIGDAVNLAARLMQAAHPGEVLVSGNIHDAIPTRFNWKTLNPIKVKGKSDAIPVFSLEGTGDHISRLQEPIYALPMIGREAELALIDERIKQTIRSRGQIIGITADAGMGKSRLVNEAIRISRLHSATGYVGECQSYGTNTSYLVWRSIWRSFFNLDEVSTLAEQRAILEKELAALDPGMLTRLPLLGTVLDIPLEDNDFTRTLEPQLRKTALEALLLDCLERRSKQLGARGTFLLLVLEDVHWLDPASYDLLELIARAIPFWPVMIVLAYRLVETQIQKSEVENLAHFTKIKLDHMNASELSRLIRAKMEQYGVTSTDEALTAQVLERAQGNPFYVEELVNYLQDRNLLAAGTTGALLELPASLHSLILSRIDQLSEHQKITLKVASIIGRLFHLAQLYGYYPALGERDQVKDALDELSRLELTPVDQIEPEIIYLFKNMVTQEVAYESLAYATRSTLHEQFAHYLESIELPDRVLDLLAYHYGRSENAEKKRAYFSRAGEAAAARFANVEAIEYFSRALDLVRESEIEERYRLMQAREKVYNLQGERDSQIQDIQALSELAERLNDNIRRVEVSLAQTQYASAIGDNVGALDAAKRAVELASTAGTQENEVEGYLEWGRILWRMANYPAARMQLEIAREKAVGRPRLEGSALRNLAVVALRQGNFDEARTYFEQSLAMFREIGDRLNESTVLKNLGNLYFFEGNFSSARTCYEQAITLYREVGYKLGESDVINNLASVLDGTGDYDQIRTLLEQALTLKRQIGDRQGECSILINLGFFAVAQGDYTSAFTYYQLSLETAEAIHGRELEASTLNNMGVLFAAQGDYASAQEYYQRSLVIKRDIGEQPGEAETLAYLAMLHHHLGSHQESFKTAQQAAIIANEVGSQLEQTIGLNVAGQALLALNRLDEAAEVFQKSYELRQELEQEHTAMEPLSGLARVALAKQDMDKAREHVEAVLAHLATRSADGLDEPVRVYLTCYQVLQALNDPRAPQILTQARDFMHARLAAISTDALRDSYLNNVPAHRELNGLIRQAEQNA